MLAPLRFTLALLPFILFGSISRVLEDSGYFTEPLVYWFISPLIYLQIAVYALSFLLFGYYIERKFKKRMLTINTILFLGGLFFLIPSLYLISKWISGEPWQETTGIHFYIFVVVISIASSIVGLVYFLSWKFGGNEKVAVYKNPLNLFMIFGHLVDGLTSYISIKDPLNMGLQYTEKHPLSDALLNIWGPLFLL